MTAHGPINTAWLPNVPMRRIHCHWTAGTNTPNDTDRRAYHLLVDGDGVWHRGVPGIELNSGGIKPGYAAHTLNANNDAIGVALCGMAGATESPFNPGRWPIRPQQMNSLVAGLRQLSAFYRIPAARQTMLTHAEVQTTLGIAQRNKWDWTRLPDDVTTIRGALAIGDWLRGRVAGASQVVAAPIPEGATGRVTAERAISSATPGGAASGQLPRGTAITVLERREPFIQVQTPAGFRVWVNRADVEITDGPAPLLPTQPDPRRVLIAQMRAHLDQLEANLLGETP